MYRKNLKKEDIAAECVSAVGCQNVPFSLVNMRNLEPRLELIRVCSVSQSYERGTGCLVFYCFSSSFHFVFYFFNPHCYPG